MGVLTIIAPLYPLFPIGFGTGWGEEVALFIYPGNSKNVGLKSASELLFMDQKDCAISCQGGFPLPILAVLWLREGLDKYVSGTLMQLGWLFIIKICFFPGYLCIGHMTSGASTLNPPFFPPSFILVLPRPPLWGPDSRELLKRPFPERKQRLRVAICPQWVGWNAFFLLWTPDCKLTQTPTPSSPSLAQTCQWLVVVPSSCWSA